MHVTLCIRTLDSIVTIMSTLYIHTDMAYLLQFSSTLFFLAQALEPESIIPLVMASSASKIVLAGDHMQLDPPVYSTLARKYNLHLSLLERLYDHEIYDNGVGQLCKTLLTENHRSHQSVSVCTCVWKL